MSRNPELEALLEAKFNLANCARDQREVVRQRFHDLLDQSIAKGVIPRLTREQLDELLQEPYREFRRAKLQEQRARLSRLR